MSVYNNEIECLVDLLQDDVAPIRIYTNDSKKSYPIQKTVLGCVSSKLAEYCDQKYNFLDVNDSAFRIFLGWLLCRKVDFPNSSDEQQVLAAAWNFGMRYEIPQFQDAVMRDLMLFLRSQMLCTRAVTEAYKGQHGSLLQRALVAKLAIDMRAQEGNQWGREYFPWPQNNEFLEDLIEAMAKVDHVAGSAVPEIQEKDFLLTATES